MRLVPILTNETCDRRCDYLCGDCQPRERPAVAAPAALRARIDAAIAAGAAELLLTGGEPTLRRDLPAIIAYIRARGPAVALATHGAHLDDAAITRLREAGLGRVQLRLPVWGPHLDHLTRTPGAWARTFAALERLRAAAIPLEVALALTPETAPTAADLLENLHAFFHPQGAPSVLLVAVQRSPDRRPLLDLGQLTALITQLTERARERGQALRLAQEAFIPPCLFDQPTRVAHLYALTPGGRDRPGHARAAECDGCVLADRCPGPPQALSRRAPPPQLRPQRDDRLRRRLSVIHSVADQIARELVTPELYRRDDGQLQRATTVRIHFHCNQSCDFCFVSTHLPPPPQPAVEAAIREAARGRGIVVLSGGEPTLSPDLERYIRLARAHGAAEIELQTNAIRLDQPGRAAALRDAGLDRAFVSLHGATADVGDAVTNARGTFQRTLAGVDALTRAGVDVRLNFVLCQKNHHQLPDAVDLIHHRWPRASLCISFVGPSTDLVPHTPLLIPSYSEVTPSLSEALRRARAHDLEITGFDSMCGIPLCLVPTDLAPFLGLAAIPKDFDRGEFAKPPPCQRCALEPRCFGVRRRYIDLYGDSELRPA
jgi:molybdenum cofactor biosynthesis enzyme MoaA